MAGALVVVPAFNLIIPDPAVLGSDAWPAPACLVWAGVSKAFANGVGGLHSSAQTAILVGCLLGLALALIEKLAPKRIVPYLPSPSGRGIAMVIPGSNCVAMFLGAAIAAGLRRRSPAAAERYVVSVSSGLIAGESLMGIVVALLVVAGVFSKQARAQNDCAQFCLAAREGGRGLAQRGAVHADVEDGQRRSKVRSAVDSTAGLRADKPVRTSHPTPPWATVRGNRGSASRS